MAELYVIEPGLVVFTVDAWLIHMVTVKGMTLEQAEKLFNSLYGKGKVQMEKFLVKIITDGTIRGEIEYLQDWHEGGGNMKAVWRMSPFAATQFDTYADAVDAIHRYHDGKSYYQIEKIFT